MKNVIILILISLSLNLFSQKSTDLYMAKEIRKAYQKGTRSDNGKPGANYFVNKADYKIIAEFNPKTRLISGNEIITYKNNSPDSLKYMYFNLYQDIYKKGNRRDWDIGKIDITDGVQISKIKFNSTEISINSDSVSNSSSILRVKLPQTIAPGSSAKVEISWSFNLPAIVSIRMGTYNKDNFLIAYWYPKVAVYDDIVRWNNNGHSGNHEFYNDFGDYDVEMTIPGDYSAWSTALLQNYKKLYTDKYLKRIEKSKTTEEIIHIITKEDRKKNDILKKADKHTWRFSSKQTPDIAIAVSKTYLWDATSIKSGNRRVSVNAVYKQDSKDFHDVAEISRNSIKFFTEEIPAYPYPYPKMTAFNGRGGMEFPGMINDGDSNSKEGTMYVTSHEIGHSYFPFYTGLNEQKYAWMDEGLITFFPQFVVKKYTKKKDYKFFKQNIRSYNYYAGSFTDVPLMIPSENLTSISYRFSAYARSAVSFYLLYNYIGKEKFSKALNVFIQRWNGKHPIPYDFFFTFNEIAGEDLYWFWKPWFFDVGHADLSIKGIKKISNYNTEIIIENITGFPVPIHLTVKYSDGTEKQFDYKMNVWSSGVKTFKINVGTKKIKKATLDTEFTPDAYPENNVKEF